MRKGARELPYPHKVVALPDHALPRVTYSAHAYIIIYARYFFNDEKMTPPLLLLLDATRSATIRTCQCGDVDQLRL